MFIKIKGKKLYWERSGDGKPLIMIHGNGGNHRGFRRSIKLLKETFTVYTLDLPGHGKSDKIAEYHYNDLASYVYEFIKMLEIKNPAYYGFSDGGIIGLILACKNPSLFSKLIVSGVNIEPDGLKGSVQFRMKIVYHIIKSDRIRMMLEEPHISKEELSNITIPVFITRGEYDVVSSIHMDQIASSIPQSYLRVFHHHFHGSYVVFSKIIGQYILKTLKD